MGLVHLQLWNLHICIRNFENLAAWNFCRKYDSSDYGPVHLPLWNLDDFHSLDNTNYRSGPSAIMKHRWSSFFGKHRLWVWSICHFETEMIFILWTTRKEVSYKPVSYKKMCWWFSFFGQCRQWYSSSVSLKPRWFSFFGQHRIWPCPSATLKPRWFLLFGQSRI